MPHTTDNLTKKGQEVPQQSGKVIYTVTTVRTKHHLHELPRPDNLHRTVGWYSERAQAFACLDINLGDLIEDGYYQYAVVEEVPDGLYPHTLSHDGQTRRWFWRAVKPHTKDGEWVWERIDDEPTDIRPPAVSAGVTTYCEIG